MSGAPSSSSDIPPTNKVDICQCQQPVSAELISVIEGDEQTTGDDELQLVLRYRSEQDRLCARHVRMYAKWATTNLVYHHLRDEMRARAQKRPSSEAEGSVAAILTRWHPTSFQERCFGVNNDAQPRHDSRADASFRVDVLRQLSTKLVDRMPKTWGELQNIVMTELLERATQPAVSGGDGAVEAYFLTGREAATLLGSHDELLGPIITQNQQLFEWDPHKGRPIDEFFSRMGGLNRTVSVQKASLSLKQESSVKMALSDVQGVFKTNEPDDPLNLLALTNPLPHSVLPAFLQGEDCQLLSRVRDLILSGEAADADRRVRARVDLDIWREEDEWALLAQGGAQTITHQDSVGKSTWLTVQQGQVGFGWMSRPTKQERRAWSKDPIRYEGGNLRYVVLRPGQTVYFEGGTIHFVFRLSETPTLMIGGHILRWSGVARWIELVMQQMRAPNTTNEDMSMLAPVYINAIGHLVLQKVDAGQIAELGGEEAVEKFLKLEGKFDRALRAGDDDL